jgi:ATP-dependent Clp protease ATP-binding subunit ClpA
VIQREVENVVARKILAGDVRQGETVVVDYQGDSLVFVTRAPAEVPS